MDDRVSKAGDEEANEKPRNLILKHHNYPNRDYFVIYVSFMGFEALLFKHIGARWVYFNIIFVFRKQKYEG